MNATVLVPAPVEAQLSCSLPVPEGVEVPVPSRPSAGVDGPPEQALIDWEDVLYEG